MKFEQSEAQAFHGQLIRKLNPSRFPRMSRKFAAIVGFIMDVGLGQPQIAEMTVTSDGFVLARTERNIGFDYFIGPYSDIFRNWWRLLDAAGLTSAERMFAESLFAKKIGYFGLDA